MERVGHGHPLYPLSSLSTLPTFSTLPTLSTSPPPPPHPAQAVIAQAVTTDASSFGPDPKPNHEYDFDHSFLSPLAMSGNLPDSEKPDLAYVIDRALVTIDTPVNQKITEFNRRFDPLDDLNDYEKLFITLRKPSSIDIWRKDSAFAEQRLSGAHPCWIKAVDAVPDVFDGATVDAALKGRFGSPAAAEAAKASLFVTDYREALADLPRGSLSGKPKCLPLCVGLFAWRGASDTDGGELVAVAVAVQDSEDAWRTVTPYTNNLVGATQAQTATAWALAKLWMQAADANVHEMWSHLYGAHFVQEPVAVATGRWLSGDHPVGQLLRPHLRILLFNNTLGKKLLVNKGGKVDMLLAATLKGSLEVAQRAAAAYDVTTSSFREDLKARGVDDTARMPHYPYRDDGLLLMGAIEPPVDAYVDGAYPDEGPAKSQAANIQADGRLVRWWASLSDDSECRYRGVPALSPATLRQMLAHWIFTGSCFHAAVNFPQYDDMAFSPNQPFSLYSPWPAELPDVKDVDVALLAALPPLDQALGQATTLDFLTNYRTERLGHYRPDTWTAPYQEAAAAAFLADLADVEREIDERNMTRPYKYEFLKPSNVPNSTSV